MDARKHVDWRMTSNGRELSRRVEPPFNDTLLQSALLDDGRLSAKSFKAMDVQYDSHGAALYVCAVISVYALFVVVFVAVLFAVRHRRRPKSQFSAERDGGEGAGHLGSYLVNAGRLKDARVRIPPPPPPPPRLRSDSSSSVSPVRRRSSRGRRGRIVAAESGGGRGRWLVDELMAPPHGKSANDCDTRRPASSSSPIDDVITLIQVEAPSSREGSDVNPRNSLTSEVTMLTPSTGTASTSASTVDVSGNRCRWSTGSSGGIWVLQIEPDDSSSTTKSSPKHSYSALASDDIGHDGQCSTSPSVISMTRADEMPLTLASSSASSSSSSVTVGIDRSQSDLVDLSVAHVIECCRQPPWDQLLPVNGTYRPQPCGDMRASRRTNVNGSWRTSTAIQSPAELQRLLHVTSV